MSERDWVTGQHLRTLLNALSKLPTERKRLLFAYACCREVWQLFSDECRRRIEAIQQRADDEATDEELEELFSNFLPWEHIVQEFHGGRQAANAVVHIGWLWRYPQCRSSSGSNAHFYADRTAQSCAEAAAKSMDWYAAREFQIHLLRDIFGNPFRPVVLDPAWLEWNNGTIVSLAKTIYDDRRWDLMPILGDALEDALCDNAAILEHCRGPGPHVRGCWVVDLILGKA